MPLWSQGFKVCVHPPLTDEARIPLDVDDMVNVTRWRKHWLFGEKIEEPSAEPAANGKKLQKAEEKVLPGKKRIRGWFPRQCAIEFYDEFDSEDDFHEKDICEKTKKQK